MPENLIAFLKEFQDIAEYFSQHKEILEGDLLVDFRKAFNHLLLYYSVKQNLSRTK